MRWHSIALHYKHRRVAGFIHATHRLKSTLYIGGAQKRPTSVAVIMQHYLLTKQLSEMTYEAIQLVDKRLVKHRVQRDKLVVPDDDKGLTPDQKQAIREERKIEDAVVEELEQLRKLMIEN